MFRLEWEFLQCNKLSSSNKEVFFPFIAEALPKIILSNFSLNAIATSFPQCIAFYQFLLPSITYLLRYTQMESQTWAKSFKKCRRSGSINWPVRSQATRCKFAEATRSADLIFCLFFFWASFAWGFYLWKVLSEFQPLSFPMGFYTGCNRDWINSRNPSQILNRHVKILWMCKCRSVP